MALFPLIERELRLRARQRLTYVGRTAASGLAILAVINFAMRFPGLGTPGTRMANTTFGFLATLAMLVASAGFITTADSISSERREGTLGLMFLTGLTTSELLLSKLAVAGFTLILLLFGVMPALALPMVMGGFTGGQVVRTALSILAVLCVSMAAGLFVSTRAHTQRQAFVWAGGLFMALTLVPWALSILFSGLPSLRWLAQAFCPYLAFQLSSDLFYVAARQHYWWSLAVTFGQAIALIAGAVFLLKRNWGVLEFRIARARPSRISIPRKKPPKYPVVIQQRSWLLDKDPICWLSLRLHDQSALIWAGAVLMIFSGFAVSAFGLGLLVFATFLPAIIFAWAAGKFFVDARQNGELELLLSTPLGGRDIVRGRWNALLLRFRGPLLLAGFALVVEFMLTVNVRGSTFAGALVPVNRVLDAIAIFWVGMWFGLTARSAFAVVAYAVGLVIGLPWLVSFFLLGWSPIGQVFLLCKNIIFIRWAAEKFRSEFRLVAPLAVGSWFKQTDEVLEQPPSGVMVGNLISK